MSKRHRLQLAFAGTWWYFILFQIFTKKLNLEIWNFFVYFVLEYFSPIGTVLLKKKALFLSGFIQFFWPLNSCLDILTKQSFHFCPFLFYWKRFQLTFTQTGKFYLCLCPGIPLPCRFPQSIQLFGKTSDGRQKWKFHQGHVINCKGCQIMKMTILLSWN